MRVAALRIGGKHEEWRELGFDVDNDGVAVLGGVRLELLPAAKQGAIESWALEGADLPGSIDGLPTESGTRGEREADNPNGATAIDHLVVFTPSLERTSAAFQDVGVECRRVREAGGGIRQGFFLMDDLLIEVVEGTGLSEGAPARFWGITAVVSDIHHAASLLGDKLGTAKDAVQPGRRIATVKPEASGGLPLALISPR
ncbi:MAG: hypothetical protein QOI31_1325 [Solirubrobacterales bacterium]|nr:hypothetical protein [Solirubrobacterales bacterium]